MKTRRVDVGLLINNQNVVEFLINKLTSYSYTDPASGEADSLQLNFDDREKKWLNEYFPKKLDMISGAIHIYNRLNEGQYEAIETGALLLDAFSFNGHPNTLSMSCISTPINSNFKETQKSNTYESINFTSLCQLIANNNGLNLITNVEDFIINSIEQKEETDADFITSICNDYGLCIKIYTDKLIIFDREIYKNQNAIKTFNASEIETYDYSSQIEGSYDGGEFTYQDPVSEQEIKAMYGNVNGRLLKISGSASSIADAQRKIKGQVLNANHSINQLNITLMGEPIFSTQCINVEGLGKLDGKYYIDKVSHNVSGGYKMTLNLSKCV